LERVEEATEAFNCWGDSSLCSALSIGSGDRGELRQLAQMDPKQDRRAESDAYSSELNADSFIYISDSPLLELGGQDAAAREEPGACDSEVPARSVDWWEVLPVTQTTVWEEADACDAGGTGGPA
jgi:hypothetical protein